VVVEKVLVQEILMDKQVQLTLVVAEALEKILGAEVLVLVDQV
tara:strand:- start:38 stop:166 length:129 start_codon:yes stop_codon:yes gene_type:complete